MESRNDQLSKLLCKSEKLESMEHNVIQNDKDTQQSKIDDVNKALHKTKDQFCSLFNNEDQINDMMHLSQQLKENCEIPYKQTNTRKSISRLCLYIISAIVIPIVCRLIYNYFM